jgi:hypothetical protein
MRTGTALLFALALLGGTPAAGQVAISGGNQHHDLSPTPLSRTPSDVQLLWSRLKTGLPSQLYASFDLFIYVNKADQGPWAQHLYAFSKPSSASPNPEMILMLDSPVSTGRETIERAKNGLRVSTETPVGFYELDPDRFETGHRSHQWLEDMPNAMFFNWDNNGARSGLAIHGVADAASISALGHRASAGCIQLSLDASRMLMDLVRDDFEGDVPQFAHDKKKHTTSTTGEFALDARGQIVMAHGYRALVIIEDLETGPVTSQLVMSPATHSG